MLNILQSWTGLRLDRRGVTALEYAIIAGVLGALLVSAFGVFGTSLSGKLSGIMTAI